MTDYISRARVAKRPCAAILYASYKTDHVRRLTFEYHGLGQSVSTTSVFALTIVQRKASSNCDFSASKPLSGGISSMLTCSYVDRREIMKRIIIEIQGWGRGWKVTYHSQRHHQSR